MEEKPQEIKFVFLGETGVGKTSMVQRFTEGSFEEQKVATIGVAYFEKVAEFGEASYKFQVWDTAGQEQFRSLASLYYRGAAAAAIVYDITQRDSLKGAQWWVKEMMRHEPEVIIVLCGNKSDLEAEREVPQEVALDYAKSQGILHVECSARTGANIRKVFQKVAEEIPSRNLPAPQENVVIGGRKKERKTSGGCAC